MNKNTLPEVEPLQQTKAKKYYLTSEIGFLSEDGDVITVDELSGDFYSNLEVLALDKHGRLSTATIHSFELVHASKIGYMVSFTSGLSITLDENTMLLTPSKDIIKPSELEFGSLVLGTVYNPSNKCPSYSTDEVLHIHKIVFEQPEPVFSFWSVTSDKTLLVTGQNVNKPSCSLISLESLNDSYIK